MNGSQIGGYTSALSAFGAAFDNSNAESSAAQFKSSQLKLDSQVTALQASSVIQAGSEESALVGKKVGKDIGQQRASYGAQGVNVDTGSAADVQSSSMVEGDLAQQAIQSNAWREAWGLRVQSSNENSEADMVAQEGKEQSFNTLMTGGMSAIADIEKGYAK